VRGKRQQGSLQEGVMTVNAKEYSVGMFTYATQPRGSVVHAAAVAEALHASGVPTTLYAMDRTGEGFYRAVNCPVVLVPAKPSQERGEPLVRRRVKELVDFVSKHGIKHDVYHAQDCLTANALLATRQAACKVVRTVHHVEHFVDPYLRECQKASIENSERLCVVSRLTQWDIGHRFARTSTVVGNGITPRVSTTPDATVTRLRARLLGDRVGPLLVSFGGVEERKNSLNLLAAFGSLKQRFPEAVWVIAGGASVLDHGEYQGRFEAALSLTDARHDVVRVGVVPETEMGALLAAADLVLCVSLQEGFGLAALEAANAGVPVVVSYGSPFDEFLSDDAAWRADPYDPTSIAHVASLALLHPFQKQLVAHSESVRQTWCSVAERCLGVYRRSAEVAKAFGLSYA
jgi:glycosyltransferase-like protein